MTVQPTPEDNQLALIRMEDMFEEYFGRGLCVNFNFEDVPKATTPHGMDRKFRHMAQTNLAIRVIPDFNKSAPQVLHALAASAYSSAYGMVAMDTMRQVQAPDRMPVGSGHRYRSRYQRFYRNEHLPPNECETINLLVGDINDYTSDFGSYLTGETIQTYTIEVSSGLRLVSDSNTPTLVLYRVEAMSASTGNGQAVSITVTSSTGRKHTHNINFIISATGDICGVGNLAGLAIAGCAIAG